MNYIYLLFAFLLFSCNDSKELHSQTQQSQIEYNKFISGIKLPATLELCGETIPIDDPEVRERAEREFYLLLQQPGQVVLYLKRSGRLFGLYEKEIAKAGLPDDIKYLSVAESALFQSRSAVGAEGLWQFMKETAIKMGLIVDDYVDERRNPQKSTVAAIKYLKDGYNGYKSWLLTFAGYNMGFAGVSDNLNFQSTNNYFDLFLNEETSRFIFRIAIIKEIMKNHEKYGFSISDDDLYKPEKVKYVKVSSGISDLSQWALTLGSNYKEVKLLNPWILKRSLPAPKNGYWEIGILSK